MKTFILDDELENVVNKQTKEYLREVVSCYKNENYRACIVTLYTAVIFDLIKKVETLSEVYDNEKAKEIMQSLKKLQKQENGSKSAWENDLILKISEELKFIDEVEKEELLHLKKERNYAAHPIIDEHHDKLQLKQITKETAADLIRKSFEIVFLRDVILGQKLVEDIIRDINEYYNRLKVEGLKEYLITKYYSRMTPKSKDRLFKDLWKFVFILDDNDCKRDRESNYYVLLYLYNENKEHYKKLIEEDKDYYFMKIKCETIKEWYNNELLDPDEKDIMDFNRKSRFIKFIEFIKMNPELYNIKCDYIKNILRTSNRVYVEKDILSMEYFDENITNELLFSEQIRLNSEVVFLADDIDEHFDNILKMIKVFMRNEGTTYEKLYRYGVLYAKSLDSICAQAEYRGNNEEFIEFLKKYCLEANTYYQASRLFSYLKRYSSRFKPRDYIHILYKMERNAQFYDNNEKKQMIEELSSLYNKVIYDDKKELIDTDEEKFFYRELTDYEGECNIEKLLVLLEDRADFFSARELHIFITQIKRDIEDKSPLKNKNIKDYPNILRKLNEEPREGYVSIFENLFKSISE